MLHKRGNLLYNIHPPNLPASAVRFTYTWGLGGGALWLFLILGLTGMLEMFYYVPAPSEANASVKVITYLSSYGWLIRNVHYLAAQGMVIASSLHLCRVFLTGGAKASRRFNWLLGLALLVLTLLMDFSGYVLRWDQDTQWALLAGTNLLKELPLAGGLVYQVLVGGKALGAPTLLRFYGWHVLGLPLVAAAFVIWHLWRVRRDGGISHPAPSCGQTTLLVSRDELIALEASAAIVVTCALVMLAAVVTVPIGPAADLNALTPQEVRAPWIFLGVQVLLRYAPPVVAGILVPATLLLALAILPFLETGTDGVGRWFAPERKRWLLAFGMLIGALVTLLVWGWLAI